MRVHNFLLQISKRPSMMSLYDSLDDFPDLDSNNDPKIINYSGEIITPNDIELMEYLNGDDDIFWWPSYLIKHTESLLSITFTVYLSKAEFNAKSMHHHFNGKLLQDVYKKLYTSIEYTNSKVWYQNIDLNLRTSKSRIGTRWTFLPFPELHRMFKLICSMLHEFKIKLRHAVDTRSWIPERFVIFVITVIEINTFFWALL